jgi:hypothetical protein
MVMIERLSRSETVLEFRRSSIFSTRHSELSERIVSLMFHPKKKKKIAKSSPFGCVAPAAQQQQALINQYVAHPDKKLTLG